jgi:hypothetical protein
MTGAAQNVGHEREPPILSRASYGAVLLASQLLT